jgi:hypothetical protein
MFSEFISNSPQGSADDDADREGAGKRHDRALDDKPFDLFFFLAQGLPEFVQRGFQLSGNGIGALAGGLQHLVAGGAQQASGIGPERQKLVAEFSRFHRFISLTGADILWARREAALIWLKLEPQWAFRKIELSTVPDPGSEFRPASQRRHNRRLA